MDLAFSPAEIDFSKSGELTFAKSCHLSDFSKGSSSAMNSPGGGCPLTPKMNKLGTVRAGSVSLAFPRPQAWLASPFLLIVSRALSLLPHVCVDNPFLTAPGTPRCCTGLLRPEPFGGTLFVTRRLRHSLNPVSGLD